MRRRRRFTALLPALATAAMLLAGRALAPDDPITVEPKRGWLIYVAE